MKLDIRNGNNISFVSFSYNGDQEQGPQKQEKKAQRLWKLASID